jgi:hypothetical protein
MSISPDSPEKSDAEFTIYSTHASVFAGALATLRLLGIVPTWHPVITATRAMSRRSLPR